MNILFITLFKIDKNKGGVQRVTATLALEFERRNYKVFYLALTQGTNEIIENIPQYYLPDRKYNSNENKDFIRNLLKEKKIEVIINQTGIYPKSFKLILTCIHPDIKFYTVHHNCIACLIKNYREIVINGEKGIKLIRLLDSKLLWSILKTYHRIRYNKYYKYIINHSSKLVLLSEHFIPELSVYLKKYDAKKIVAIPNPAPFEIQSGIQKKKENRLIYVGRINYSQKRTDLLLDIWRKIYKDFPNWHLDVVGDGPLLSNLKKRVNIENIERINFYGFRDPRPFLEKAKYFIMTSAFEGYGMVLVEAQAYGVVPFAFNCFSAINDIIHDEINGFVIEQYSIEEYCKKLSGMMLDENRREIISLNCLNSVRKFLPELIVEKWISEFCSIDKRFN